MASLEEQVKAWKDNQTGKVAVTLHLLHLRGQSKDTIKKPREGGRWQAFKEGWVKKVKG